MTPSLLGTCASIWWPLALRVSDVTPGLLATQRTFRELLEQTHRCARQTSSPLGKTELSERG